MKMVLKLSDGHELRCEQEFNGQEITYVKTYLGMMRFDLERVRGPEYGPPETQAATFRLTRFFYDVEGK